MVGDDRHVGVLAALEQARAADGGDCRLAIEAHEKLVAHHRAAGGEQKLVEARMCADRRHQRRDMQRAGPLPGDLDVVDMRLVADDQFERRVHLVVAGALVALDQHRAGTALNHDERADEDRRRPLAAVDEQEMDRPRERHAGGDMDHGTVAHEGGVERDRDIIRRHHLAELCRDNRIVCRQRLRHGTNAETRLERGKIG